MAAKQIVTEDARLVLPRPMYQQLMDHLFPGDGDEHGAVILAGIATVEGRSRLLARELVIARDGIDYVPGERGYRMLKAEFVLEQIERCSRERLVYLAVHNHGGIHSVAFSPTDLRSHERGYPALLDIVDGLPVGALVFAREAVAGDLWNPDGSRVELESTTVVGDRRLKLTPQPIRYETEIESRFDRQVRLFGPRGQQILNGSHVAIVGLGGVGSIVAELLARLGVGRFTLIDPDFVEESNLPRLIGARVSDAFPSWYERLFARLSRRTVSGIAKVDYATRIIKQANPNAFVHALQLDFLKPQAAGAILDADYTFLAADTHQARLLFNAVVHQYLIPGIQIGSKISHERSSGTLVDVFSVARPLTTYSGCLMCNGLIDSEKLLEESLSSEERRRQRYVEGEEIVAPSVMALNAMGASNAVNRFMMYITGLSESAGDYLIQHALTDEFNVCEPLKDV